MFPSLSSVSSIMSPPPSKTKLLAVLPHLCKLSTVVVLLLFFIPSLVFSLIFFSFLSVFLFFPHFNYTLNFSTFFLSTSTVLTGRILLTSVIRRIFWRSCGWIVGCLSDSDTKKVDDGGEPLECIDLNKSEFPSFDASSNPSSEEEVEQEQLLFTSYQEETKEAREHEEQRLKDETLAPVVDKNEESIINNAMSWDLDALLGLEDDSGFRRLLLFWRMKERGLV